MAGKTDGYRWKKSDPRAAQHALLDALLTQVDFEYSYGGNTYEKASARKDILAQPRAANRTMLLACLERMDVLEQKAEKIRARAKHKAAAHHEKGWDEVWGPRQILYAAFSELLKRKLPLTQDDLERVLRWALGRGSMVNGVGHYWLPLTGIVKSAETLAKQDELGTAVRELLGGLRARLVKGHPDTTDLKLAARIENLLGTAPEIRIEPGEAWADRALADLASMDAETRRTWGSLIAHCRSVSGGTPPAKWEKAARALVASLGREELEARLLAWFPLVDKPRTKVVAKWSEWAPNPNLTILPGHLDILKGLVWCCDGASREMARALTALAVSCYRKLPGIGPRAVKLGNACVYILGQLPGTDGVDQLAVLKVRVTFKTAQKGIAKAMADTASRLGIAADELEEMGIPSYGLTEVGRRVDRFGEYAAELRVGGAVGIATTWSKVDTGRELKSVPAAVKRDFADELKELRTAAKDIQKMLPAQRQRIDGLFLAERSWDLTTWHQRYLDHPLLGVLARRLIWTFRTADRLATGIYHNGSIVDAAGRPLESLGDDCVVRLWHPFDQTHETIAAWRAWLERNEVTQPFKQAHRELYRLTPAERETETYSNRFAAHVVRQHQFNALCAVRGWRNSLRLMVDDELPPPSLFLPNHELRAEFWTDGIGDEYGVDTNATGTFHYLSTDQVRFYDTSATGDAEPVPLERIPPLVLSEVFRDIDLFVGVASVGNDPNWHDGGPDGRYHDYWHSYSFGPLTATAQTRRDILERLVPRLKIADRCSFSDKFLVVRGDIRTYKIHLGSSNILMSPDDQYLCIVPGRGKVTGPASKVFLPFEGDSTMSVILSKAFLLATDAKIKDRTILSQIR